MTKNDNIIYPTFTKILVIRYISVIPLGADPTKAGPIPR